MILAVDHGAGRRSVREAAFIHRSVECARSIEKYRTSRGGNRIARPPLVFTKRAAKGNPAFVDKAAAFALGAESEVLGNTIVLVNAS